MLRLLIIDKSRLVCDSVRTALANEEGIYVVGCAVTLEETLFLLPHVNVVIMSTSIGDNKVIEYTYAIKEQNEAVKVIVTGVSESPESVIRFIEAGASGHVFQHESITDLVQKMHAAYEDKAILSPEMAAQLMLRLSQLSQQKSSFMLQPEETLPKYQTLTDREIEVLHLIGNGCTNREISDALYIEYGTAKNHVHNILKKLETSNREEAAAVYKMHQQKVDMAIAA